MSDTSFADHFSSVSAHYAGFRPRYPAALFDWLVEIAPGRDLVWDCACGSGQASADLATRFAQVLATDASASQIAAAPPQPGITYRQAPADASGLSDASVDLVTVAQALHWLDLPRFYAEVRRVLKPGGVLAVWTYGVLTVSGDDVNALAAHFYHDTVGPYWPPERKHVEEGYRTLDFPFAERQVPPFAMRAEWPMARLLGYLSSWSATARYKKARGEDPIPILAETLGALWGDPLSLRTVTWPLAVRVGRG